MLRISAKNVIKDERILPRIIPRRENCNDTPGWRHRFDPPTI